MCRRLTTSSDKVDWGCQQTQQASEHGSALTPEPHLRQTALLCSPTGTFLSWCNPPVSTWVVTPQTVMCYPTTTIAQTDLNGCHNSNWWFNRLAPLQHWHGENLCCLDCRCCFVGMQEASSKLPSDLCLLDNNDTRGLFCLCHHFMQSFNL